jgi:hypothetical protein
LLFHFLRLVWFRKKTNPAAHQHHDMRPDYETLLTVPVKIKLANGQIPNRQTDKSQSS